MRTASVLTSLVVAAATATAGTGLVAAPASAATAITCGATVTGNVYLSRDLTCSGNGLTVTGDSTVDLRGHRLRHGGTGVRSVGIMMTGSGSITVRNGRLSDWSTAVVTTSAGDDPDPADSLGSAVIDRVSFSGNDTGVDGTGPFLGSIQSRDALVKRSRFADNYEGVSTFYGSLRVETSVFTGNHFAGRTITGALDIQHSVLTNNNVGLDCDEAGCLLAHSRLRDNPIGVSSRTYGVRMEDNTVTGSDTGYTSFSDWGGATLTGNRFVANTTAVEVGFASSVTLTDNVFTRNASAVVATDTEPGDPGDDFAARATLTGNRFTRNGDAINLLILATLKDNAAVRNTGWGIYAPNATDLGGNTARGNGRSPQCTGVVCS